MKRFLCAKEALGPGEAVLFEGVVRGEPRPCVLLGAAEGPVAFVNVCAHRNRPVVVRERPLDPQNRTVECEAHGAIYEAASGECVEGPCVGARLIPVALEITAEGIHAVDDDVVDDSIYAEG